LRFWDSSALVPLFVAEETTKPLRALLRNDPAIMAWWAAEIECASAIARRESEGVLSALDARAARDGLADVSTAWQEVQPVETVRRTAQRLLRLHPLRAADALQLAAAVAACEGQPALLPFVSLDDRQREAAEREGFPVDPVL
jgi:uncharacterized protein